MRLEKRRMYYQERSAKIPSASTARVSTSPSSMRRGYSPHAQVYHGPSAQMLQSGTQRAVIYDDDPEAWIVDDSRLPLYHPPFQTYQTNLSRSPAGVHAGPSHAGHSGHATLPAWNQHPRGRETFRHIPHAPNQAAFKDQPMYRFQIGASRHSHGQERSHHSVEHQPRPHGDRQAVYGIPRGSQQPDESTGRPIQATPITHGSVTSRPVALKESKDRHIVVDGQAPFTFQPDLDDIEAILDPGS